MSPPSKAAAAIPPHSSSEPANNNEYYEHLKRLKEMYHNYFRTPNLTFTWENVNVYHQESNRCLFFKPKYHAEDTGEMATSSNGTPSSVSIYPGGQQQQRSESSVILQTSPPPVYISTNENNSTDSIVSSSSSSSNSGAGSSLTATSKSTHILVDADGIIRSGECLAIMGASGSGKTTLLNVLNFKNLKKFTVDAKIKLNGRLITESDLVNRSAYVQQDDLFIPNITVKEHLIFLVNWFVF
jgi:ABC-type glutathione transport system ATPase component